MYIHAGVATGITWARVLPWLRARRVTRQLADTPTLPLLPFGRSSNRGNTISASASVVNAALDN